MRNSEEKKQWIKQWVKERDAVISTLDVDEFKRFYEKYKSTLYGDKELPSNTSVIQASICKMALCGTNINNDVKRQAASWLLSHGYTLEV